MHRNSEWHFSCWNKTFVDSGPFLFGLLWSLFPLYFWHSNSQKKLFPLKRQRSAPQGVLLSSVLMMLFTIASVFVLDTLAPRYLMFGGQTYLVNGTEAVPCSVLAPATANCSVTQIERIVTDVKFRFSFFAFAFYWCIWIFLGFFVIGVIFSICIRVNPRLRSNDESD